jgi:hypothetical protein
MRSCGPSTELLILEFQGRYRDRCGELESSLWTVPLGAKMIFVTLVANSPLQKISSCQGVRTEVRFLQRSL